MAEKLKIIPLGGLNEIGKNMTAYEYGGEIIVVDCGMAFPGDAGPAGHRAAFILLHIFSESRTFFPLFPRCSPGCAVYPTYFSYK